MPNLNSFVSSTDFATLRQVQQITGTITIPAVSVSGGAQWKSEQFFTIKTGRVYVRARMYITGFDKWFLVNYFGIAENDYTMILELNKVSDTSFRAIAQMWNPYTSTITLIPRTVNFVAEILVSPFQP